MNWYLWKCKERKLIQSDGSYGSADLMERRVTVLARRQIENGVTMERTSDHVAITRSARKMLRIRFLEPWTIFKAICRLVDLGKDSWKYCNKKTSLVMKIVKKRRNVMLPVAGGWTETLIITINNERWINSCMSFDSNIS